MAGQGKKVGPHAGSMFLILAVILIFAAASGFFLTGGGSADKTSPSSSSPYSEASRDFLTLTNRETASSGQSPAASQELIPPAIGGETETSETQSQASTGASVSHIVSTSSRPSTSTAPPPDPASGNPDTYQIYISKNSFTVAVLSRDAAGQYTQVVKIFKAATGGTKTRTGTFEIQHKDQKFTKLRWYSFNTSFSGHCPYATYFTGGVYFHGPIFHKKDPHTLNTKFYNRIGKANTSGCLRLPTAQARWIYYNCPYGTKVIVANDDRYRAPEHEQIPPDQFWDPTDPDARPPVTAFELNISQLELEVGESFQLALQGILPSNTATVRFIFESGQPAVAEIDSQGLIRGLAEGIAIIRVRADDVYAVERTCTVLVRQTEGSDDEPGGG